MHCCTLMPTAALLHISAPFHPHLHLALRSEISCQASTPLQSACPRNKLYQFCSSKNADVGVSVICVFEAPNIRTERAAINCWVFIRFSTICLIQDTLSCSFEPPSIYHLHRPLPSLSLLLVHDWCNLSPSSTTDMQRNPLGVLVAYVIKYGLTTRPIMVNFVLLRTNFRLQRGASFSFVCSCTKLEWGAVELAPLQLLSHSSGWDLAKSDSSFPHFGTTSISSPTPDTKTESLMHNST